MIAGFPIHNLLQAAAQTLILACLGAMLPAVFRIEHPRSNLWWLQCVLWACLLLPWIGPQQHPVVVLSRAPAPAAHVVRAIPAQIPSTAIDWDHITLAILLAGAIARLLWLGMGMFHVRRCRIAATPLYPLPPAIAGAQSLTGASAQFCIAPGFQSPATFGIIHPVVLLPEAFAALEPEAQIAIASHELIHVRRRDWAVSLAEEAAAALFWFHPGVWWLLSKIRLTREQLVDSEVVRLTGAPETYVRSLIAVAGLRARLDLVPAPLFLRRRHLTLRMHSILKEVRMSRIRLSLSYVSITTILAGAAWTALVTFPLAGEAQIQVPRQADAIEKQAQAGVPDGPGVTVDTGGAILHRTRAVYPDEARNNHVEGTVMVDLQLNAAGEVEDAHAVSGPDGLRAAALQSVLQWHYVPDGSNSRTVHVAITYQVPQPPGALDSAREAQLAQILDSSKPIGTLVRIDTTELPPALQSAVRPQLQPFEGQGFSNHAMNQIRSILSAADSHLYTSIAVAPGQNFTLTVKLGTPPAMILPANTPAAYQFPAGSIPRINVGSRVQEVKLATKVSPANPTGAIGTVSIWIVISVDGRVTQTHVQDGPTELQQAALDAVQQYTYQPTLLNDKPCEVETLVKVPFGQ